MNVGMPPRSRNHRLPAAPDAPTATAASSLDNPLATSRQKSRSTSRRREGAPGDFAGDRPVSSFIHPAGLPINTSEIKALRRPVESAQYTSLAFTEALLEAGIAGSIGSVGDALDNALMESTIGLFKTELIDRQRSWTGRTEVERETAAWVHWFNTDRLHSSIGYRPPVEFEELYRDTTTTPALEVA
jgi:hypothetical protein